MANAISNLIQSKEAARPQGYAVGQQLPLDQIRIDGGTQARAGLDESTVAEYADAWLTLSHRQNGFLEMPLITVYHDGKDYWLADGFHRVEAYTRFVNGPSAAASPRAIRAEVRQGTRRDAVLYACGANSTHGLRRTNADKRRAIETLLRDDEWRQWSDSEIARRCAVSDKTVASVRADLYPRNSEDSRLVERSGTVYQQKPPAPKPNVSEHAPITIKTKQAQYTLIPTRSTGVLALHDAVGAQGWAITHIESGKRVALFQRRLSADTALDRLIPLDWQAMTPEGGMARPLALQVARILVAFDDVDQLELRRQRLSELDPQADAPAAPFWQAMSPNHPTAHLWTRTGMNDHRAACGMIASRVPSGSVDAGHCSSCVRATWPQNQAQPDPAHVAALEEQIESGDQIPEAAMLIGDDALMAEIRAKASALGLELLWEDDTVILHWPDEDIETLLGMGYQDALYWLATDGAQQAEHRQQLGEIARANAAPIVQPARPRGPAADWWNVGSEQAAISAAIGQGDRLKATRAALHLAVVIIGNSLIDYGGHMSEAEYEALKLLTRREKMEG